MNEEADVYLVELLRSMFPTLTAEATPAMTNYIRSGMHEVKVTLKRDSQRLELLIKRNNPEVTRRWVDAIKKHYEQWYAAAEKISAQ